MTPDFDFSIATLGLTKVLKKQVFFEKFITEFDVTRQLMEATTVAKITSIVIKRKQCYIIVGNPDHSMSLALEFMIYGSEFEINESNYLHYVGKYVLLSYVRAYEEILIHAFSSQKEEFLDAPEKVKVNFIATAQEETVLLKSKRDGVYRTAGWRTLQHMIWILRRRHRQKKLAQRFVKK